MSNCRDCALGYITFKDRTEKEVFDKLLSKGFSEEEIYETLDFLKAYRYIDDKAYAKRFISDATNLKKWGKGRIYSELIKRGVSFETIEETVQESAFEFGELLLIEMKRRFEGADLSNIKERNRIFGYFARRGYAPGEIKGAMNTMCSFNDIIDYDE